MSAYLSFLQVFFSKQFTEFLDLREIPDYRRICKKARNVRIDVRFSSSEYTRKQIQEKIPLDANEYYEMAPNTFFNRLEHDMNRYYQMFRHIRVEDRLECPMYLELFDSDKDIDQEEKNQLYCTGKRHYMYTHFKFDHCHRHVLAFSSQHELLAFVIHVTNHVHLNRFYHCESCVFEQFSDILVHEYSNTICKQTTEEKCSECIEFEN